MPPPRHRLSLLAATVLVVAAGLALRLAPIGLPGGVVKYGGSTLWGAMVYGLVAAALLRPRSRVAGWAAAIALAVEAFRLVHTPWLDAFRLTLPGQLLLGRVFSGWNLLAYAVGISAAALIDGRLRPLHPPKDGGRPDQRSRIARTTAWFGAMWRLK